MDLNWFKVRSGGITWEVSIWTRELKKYVWTQTGTKPKFLMVQFPSDGVIAQYGEGKVYLQLGLLMGNSYKFCARKIIIEFYKSIIV